MSVTGEAYLNVPQPPATGGVGPGARAAEPQANVVADDQSQQLPLCTELVPDPNAAPDEQVFCRGGESMSNQSRALDGDSWTTALQPYCNDLPERQWAGNRSYECMWRKDFAFIASKQTGEPIGEVQYVQEHELRTTWNSKTWNGRSAIHILHAFGAGTTAVYGGSVTCSSNTGCTPGGETGIHSLPMTTSTSIMDYTVDSPVLGAGQQQSFSVQAKFDFTSSEANPPKTYSPTGIFPVVRCDADGNGKQGCVVPAAEPILNMGTRGVPSHAQHIRNGQASGLPGAPGGTPLTRSSDPTRNQSNRDSSCNKIPGPRPSGIDCDEYPFATTYEGGAGGGPARTYNNCSVGQPGWVQQLDANNISFVSSNGISMCLISRADNRRGGGITTWFFRKNRLLDGEKFYVQG